MRKTSAKQQLSQITESGSERNIRTNAPSQQLKTPTSKSNRPQSSYKIRLITSPYSVHLERDNEKSILLDLNRWKSPNVIYSFNYEQMHKEHSLSNVLKKNISKNKFDQSSERLANITSPSPISQDEPPFRMRETVKRFLYNGECEDSYQQYVAFSKHFSNIKQENRQMSAAVNRALEINEDMSAADAIKEYTARKIKKSLFESPSKKTQKVEATKIQSTASGSPQLLKLKSLNSLTNLDRQILSPSKTQTRSRFPSTQIPESLKALGKPKHIIRIQAGKVVNISNRAKASQQQKDIKDLRKDLAYLADEYLSSSQKKRDDGEQFRALLKKDIDRLKNEINQKKKERSKELMVKLADTIFRCASKIKMFKLSLEEVLATKICSAKPFGRPGSDVFINACRDGDIKVAERCLKENRFLVFEVDYTGKTGLHWAALKGHFPITKLIVQTGADLDARDVGGRTPLMLAAKGGDATIVQLLIDGGANMNLLSDGKKLAMDFTGDSEILKIFHQSVKRSAQKKRTTYTRFTNFH